MFHHPGAYHSQWGRFNLGAKLAEKKVFIALFLSVGRPSFVNSILNRIEKKEGGKKAASALPQEEFMPAGITLIFFLILSFFVHSALCIALIPVGISRSIVGLCRGVGTSPAQSAGCETGAWSGSFQTGDPLCHIVSEYAGGSPQSSHHNSWGLQPSKTRFPSSDLTFSLQGFLSSLKWLTATGARQMLMLQNVC